PGTLRGKRWIGTPPSGFGGFRGRLLPGSLPPLFDGLRPAGSAGAQPSMQQLRQSPCPSQSSGPDTREEGGDDPPGGPAVPQFGRPPPRPFRVESFVDLLPDLGGRHEAVRPLVNRDGALGRVAHRQAWNAEIGRLLLDAARIGDEQSRSADEAHEFDVAQRIDQPNRAERRGKAEFGEAASRPRMNWKDQGQSSGGRSEFG